MSEDYEFSLDAFTPSTIPMARLAEYLRELALLLGSQEKVHFRSVKSGSVRILASVEREAVPKVRIRLQNARDPEAPKEVRRHFERIDEMLREDNGVARLMRGSSNVVKFPGREGIQSARMGPFSEDASLQGMIVRVGGIDDTAHVLIKTADGPVESAEVSHDLAMTLAAYLYRQPVRLIGRARRERTETGQWKLLRFVAKDFEVLKADELKDVFARLRVADSGWKEEKDPLAVLEKIRGH